MPEAKSPQTGRSRSLERAGGGIVQSSRDTGKRSSGWHPESRTGLLSAGYRRFRTTILMDVSINFSHARPVDADCRDRTVPLKRYRRESKVPSFLLRDFISQGVAAASSKRRTGPGMRRAGTCVQTWTE